MKDPIHFECGRLELLSNNILLITFTTGEATVPQIEEYHEKLLEALDSFEGPFVAITDASGSRWLSGEGRIALGKLVNDIETRYQERYKKSIMVLPNAILKMMLSGVNLISPPKVPQEVFTKLADAKAAAELEVVNWKK